MINIQYINSRDNLIDKVIALGDENTKTLGLMPREGYRQHADRSCLLVATKNDDIAGFILFRKTVKNRRIRIVQLCVNSNFRGKGIGDSLIDKLKDDFKSTYRGIALNCRIDYKSASKLWKRNGFYPLNEKRGRGKKETWLLQWLYDFNKNDLFTNIELTKVRVLIDVNIIIRTRDISTATDYKKSPIIFLLSDDILSDVEYLYANETLLEITKDSNSGRRERTRRIMSQFNRLTMNPSNLDEIRNKVKKLCPPTKENDFSDRDQISEAIANNIEYFITTDEKMQKECEVLSSYFSIQIFTPSQFLIHFDQIQNSSSYLPRRLGGTDAEFRKATISDIELSIDLFHSQFGEKKGQFKSRLDEYSSRPKSITNVVSVDRNTIDAIINYEILLEGISLNIIRISNLRNRYVLFNQLIAQISRAVINMQLSLVRIKESELDSEMKRLLEEMYYREEDSYLIRTFKYGFLSKEDAVNSSVITNSADNESNYDLSNNELYEIERSIFPGKVKGLDVNNYIIPIKPRWASQLFDYNVSNYLLFGAAKSLIWNRNNIYYRSVNPNVEALPGRVFWYVSRGNKYETRVKGIVASSYIEQIIIDKPKKMFKDFEKLGVYKWKNIYELAKKDVDRSIKAIEFSDTEVFENVVPLSKIQTFLGNRQTFQSVVRITDQEFTQIYNSTLKDE